MSKHNRKLIIIIFLINLLLLIPLSVFYKTHMSVDSYGILLEGLKSHALTFISSFRYFGAFIIKLLSLTDHNPIINPVVDIAIFVPTVAISVTMTVITLCTKARSNDILSIIVVDLAVILSFENVWFCNLLTFPECILLTAIGVLLCCTGITVFAFKRNACGCIITCILLVCSTAVYQQFITVFAIYIIAIIGIEVAQDINITLKKLVALYIKPAFLIVFSGALYFSLGKLMIKIFRLTPNERVALNISTIIDNIKYFLTHQHSFLKGRGYFDTEILTLSFVAIGIVWLISLIVDWLIKRNNFRTLFLLASYFVAYISSYLLGLISTSHATRTMFGLFSIFALFVVGIIALSDKKTAKIIVLVILLIILPINILKTISERQNQLEENNAASVYIENVYKAINEFESESGNEIKKIAFSTDATPDITNGEAIYTNYALKAMLSLKNCENGKVPYDYIDMPDDIYDKFFSDNNMTEFNAEEQIVFDTDTAYICIY